MDFQLIKRSSLAVLLSMLLPVTAISQVGQILDRVEGFNENALVDLDFEDPNFPFSFIMNNPNANIVTCDTSTASGFWCLNGSDVLNITNPSDTTLPAAEFSCNDPALKLNTKKGRPCLDLAVNVTGAVYISGSEKGKTYAIIKAVKVGVSNSCIIFDPGSFRLEDSPDWCAVKLTTGRPLTDGMIALSGQVADDFVPSCSVCSGVGEGVIVLEQRRAVVFISDDGSTEVIAANKRDWNLDSKEFLYDIGLLQTTDGATVRNFVLATSSKDRVRAVDVLGAPNGRVVFDIAADRLARLVPGPCNSDDQRYGITTSISGLAYITDNNFCEALALAPDALDSSFMLDSIAAVSTSPTALNGPMATPGIVIDLKQCGNGGQCDFEFDQFGNPTATLSNANVVSNESNIILFHITDIPDCRLATAQAACVLLLPNVGSPSELYTKNVILDPTGTNTTATLAAQRLNVTPLLPEQVTELFLPGELPDMWISHGIHAQASGFFDAYFAKTEAQLSGAADLVLEIQLLTGTSLGCREGDPTNTPVSTLLDYDVVAKVSENFITIDHGPIAPGANHETMLNNTGCGSTFARIGRWSFMALNLEFSADSFDEVTVIQDDDALFAKLVLSLLDDLDAAVDQLACKKVDGQSATEQPPLSGSTCTRTRADIALTKQKIEKCIEAATIPKSSSTNENCGAAVAHLNNLESTLTMQAPEGDDPANRIGENIVRINVIQNVYHNLFFPSIPDAGFEDF